MKKLLVVLMCVLMVISMIPTMAFADTKYHTIDLYYVDVDTGVASDNPAYSINVEDGQSFGEALRNVEYSHYNDYVKVGYNSFWNKGTVDAKTGVVTYIDQGWLQDDKAVTESATYYLKWEPINIRGTNVNFEYNETISEDLSITHMNSIITEINIIANDIINVKEGFGNQKNSYASDNFINNSINFDTVVADFEAKPILDGDEIVGVDFNLNVSTKKDGKILATESIEKVHGPISLTIDLPKYDNYSYFYSKEVNDPDFPNGVNGNSYEDELGRICFEFHQFLGPWGITLEIYDEPEFEGEQIWVDVPADDFLASAKNGLITLEDSTNVSGSIVFDDGKDYVIDLKDYSLNFIDIEGSAITVKDSTLKIIGNRGEAGFVSSTGNHTITLDGDINKTVLEIGSYISMEPAGEEAILIKGGTLKSKGNHFSGLDDNYMPLFPIKIANEKTAKVELTGGFYHCDVNKYVAEGYTVGAWINNPNTEDQRLMYWVMKVPTNDKELEEAIYNEWVAYKGDNGYYYENAEAVKMANVKAEKIASWVQLDIADVHGICRMGDTIPVKNNESIEKWYKLCTGADLQLPEYDGYHFAGWYKVTYSNDGSGKMIYSNTKVEVTDPINEDMCLGTKWCNETKTTVIGKVDATYAADGYTGDVVCAECKTIVEKGTVIPKLLKIEEGKIQVTESVLEEVIKEAITSNSNEVVISLADAKEEVSAVELPVSSIEAVLKSGKALTIETPVASVTLDANALATVADKAEGTSVELQIKTVEVKSLSAKQQEAVKDIKLDVIISAEVICMKTGKEISTDFGGGKATIELPFEPAKDAKLSDYTVIYIADDGSITVIPTKAVNGKLVFEIGHFSEYAVVKASEVKSLVPNTGDANTMMPWVILVATVAAGMLVLKRREN